MRAVVRLFGLILFASFVGLIASCDDGGSDGGGSSGGGGGGGGGGAQTGNTPTAAEESLAQQVLTLVNQERAAQSLAPLTMHAPCAQVAYDHSWDMDARNFFAHNNPDGHSPFQRMANAGISYSAAAENIAMGYGTPQAVMAGWMASQGHHDNIMNPVFTQIGIGVRLGSNGDYWTQVFRTP
ncbi:MAG: CAP domain-containing protein [Planctomycetes bacterium]|nr:CAP domain-containing protein [Planctomycetota bacterium]